jgi:hypothetical protein
VTFARNPERKLPPIPWVGGAADKLIVIVFPVLIKPGETSINLRLILRDTSANHQAK